MVQTLSRPKRNQHEFERNLHLATVQIITPNSTTSIILSRSRSHRRLSIVVISGKTSNLIPLFPSSNSPKLSRTGKLQLATFTQFRAFNLFRPSALTQAIQGPQAEKNIDSSIVTVSTPSSILSLLQFAPMAFDIPAGSFSSPGPSRHLSQWMYSGKCNRHRRPQTVRQDERRLKKWKKEGSCLILNICKNSCL